MLDHETNTHIHAQNVDPSSDSATVRCHLIVDAQQPKAAHVARRSCSELFPRITGVIHPMMKLLPPTQQHEVVECLVVDVVGAVRFLPFQLHPVHIFRSGHLRRS